MDLKIRTTSLLRLPAVWWLGVIGLVLFFVAIVTSLDRYVEWDEAVFYSQSGGYKGTEPPPMPLAASREGGPGMLIALVRLTGVGLVGVRAAWVVTALVLAAWVYWRLSRYFEPAVGPAAFAFFGMSWLSMTYLGSLYGSLLNGLLLIAAAVILLDLAVEPTSTARSRLYGIALGLSIAGAFWMRHAESVIGVLVLLILSLLIDKAVLWRRQLVPGLIALGCWLGAFVVPWIIWSIRVFGSVGARFDALGNQVSGNAPLQLTNGLTEYLDALTATARSYGLFDAVPTWPRVIIVATAAVLVVLVLFVIGDRRLTSIQRWAVVVVLAPAAVLLVFFAFYYASVEVRERYLTTLVPFAAGLAGIAVVWVVQRLGSIRPRRVLATGVAIVLGLWVVAQVAIAVPFQRARVVDGLETLVTSDAIRASVENRPCVGLSRYGRAQVQLGSGCSVRSAATDEIALRVAAEYEETGADAFVLWPHPLDLGSDWIIVERTSEAAPSYLHLLRSGSS